MRDVGRADAKGQRAKGPMRRCVRVPAIYQQTGQSQAQFRSDHMDDTLFGVVQVKQMNTIFYRISA